MENIPQESNTAVVSKTQEEIWLIKQELISPFTDKKGDLVEDVIPDEKFKWFQIVLPSSTDSPAELKEKQEAQFEQIRRGIIKVHQQQPTEPQIISGIGTARIPGTCIPMNVVAGPAQMNLAEPQQSSSSIQNKKIQWPTKLVRKQSPNEPCACGSGKKFKKCHGRGQ